MENDDEPEFVPDMLTRWYNDEDWSQALNNMDAYFLHEQLFKTTGAEHGMGRKFLRLLQDNFGDMGDEELHKAYLRLILPVLHERGVKLLIHAVETKGDFVPWEMYGTSDGTDTITYPEDN